MPDPQLTVALPTLRRGWLNVAVLVLCSLVMTLVALLRVKRRGVRLENKAEHLLGGNIHMFNNMNALFDHLTQVCLLCAVIVLVFLGMTFRRHPRAAIERLVAISSFWILCLTSGIVAKRAFSHLIGPEAGTLPSGHTLAALSACGAVILAAAGRWREFWVPTMAFASSLYVLSVVNSYVHRPGDALTAIALCAGWAVFVDVSAGGTRLPRRDHELSNRVLVGIGSATALVTAIGWGAAIQPGLGNHVAGWLERIVLISAGGVYALYLARVADRLGGRVRPAHDGADR